MNGRQQSKPYFWPVIFLAAFVFGAALWTFWMYKEVQRAHRQRQSGFFVPVSTPTQTISNLSVTNGPAGTN